MTENEISYKIRGCVFEVYNTLGAGLLESVYEAALAYELRQAGLRVERQRDVPVNYKNQHFDVGFRLDLLVEDKVIVELKSVAEMRPVFAKQLLTYLRLTGKRLGLLINFGDADIAHGITRMVNNLPDPSRR